MIGRGRISKRNILLIDVTKNTGDTNIISSDSTKTTNTTSNEVAVLSVYVTISSPICNRPYSSGNPTVDDTLITVSDLDTADVRDTLPTTTSGIRLSNLI